MAVVTFQPHLQQLFQHLLPLTRLSPLICFAPDLILLNHAPLRYSLVQGLELLCVSVRLVAAGTASLLDQPAAAWSWVSRLRGGVIFNL